MVDKNIRLKGKNKTTGGFDNLFPQTKAELVLVKDKKLSGVLEETTAQLAHIATQGYASLNGLEPVALNPKDGINNFVSELTEKGIRTAIFDTFGEYKVTEALTEGHTVLKIGNATVSKYNPDNWFYEIIKSEASFKGKVNSYSQDTLFSQIKAAIARDNTVNICFIGDSITTSGGTTSKIKLKKSGYDGFVMSPNGTSRGDSYPQRLMELLAQEFPTTTFNYTNYAVGGERILTLFDEKTFDGATKKWIDFAKDAKPDLLIIGFGMNNSITDYVSKSAYVQKKTMDYVKANFNPVPMMTFVTNPRPVYIPTDTSWGSYSRHSPRFVSANITRAIAQEYGAYTIDVGRLSDIKRIGLDYTKPITKKMELDEFTISPSGVTENVGGSYLFSPNGTLRIKNNPLKDFTIKLTLNFKVLASGSQNDLTISFNDNNEKNNQCVYNPKYAGGTERLTSYLRIADHTNWTLDGGYKTGEYIGTASTENTDVVLTIRKRGSRVEYYVKEAEVKVLSDYADTFDVHGDIQIKYSSGSGGGVTIKDIQIWGSDYVAYKPTMTDEDFYGHFISNDYGTKEPYGGNGANHPSSIGIEEVYVPALEEFVQDIKLAIR